MLKFFCLKLIVNFPRVRTIFAVFESSNDVTADPDTMQFDNVIICHNVSL